MDHAPAAAASASGEAPRASDAIAGHEDAAAHHLVGPLEASMSTPADSFMDSEPMPSEARQGGGNEGSLITSSGVNQAGSKRKACASANGAKRVKKNGQPRRAGRSRKTTQSASSDPPVSATELRRRHHRLTPLNTFSDWEGVETALSKYASAAGFSFGVRNCKKLADKMTVSKMTWTCSRAGKPRSTSTKQPSSGKSPGSSSMRCQCPVSVTVWRKSDGVLYISKSELGHNHALDTSAAASAHLTAMATEREKSARFEELKTCALELLRQASKSEVATKRAKSVLDQLQSDLSDLDASSDQNAVPEPSNCDAVANRAQPLAVDMVENEMQEHEDGAVLTVDPRDMSELLRALEVLNQGVYSSKHYFPQRLTWDLVRLLSGMLSTFDGSQLQHTKLREAIRKGLPFVMRILREKLEDTDTIHLTLNALCVLQFLSSNDKADIVVEADAVPCLLQALHSDIPKLQIQAALCLSDIASASTDFRTVITESCSSNKVLPYLQHSSPALRSAAESLLRSLFDFPNVMERRDYGPELVDVLAGILFRRSRDEVRKYTDMNGGGELVLTNKAAPISFWRVFEIQTGKPSPNNTDRVRVIREIDETHLEVKSVARDVKSLQYRFYRVKKTEVRPVKLLDVENNDPEEKGLLSEDELQLVEYCSALEEMCCQNYRVVEKLVDPDLYPPLVELLYVSNSTIVCSSVLRLLCYIMERKYLYSQDIDSKLLEIMPSVLQSRSRELREEALGLLGSLVCREKAVMLAMIQLTALVTSLVATMEWGVVDAGIQAAWILCDLIQHATPEFATQMIDQNVIKMFSEMLHEDSGHKALPSIVRAIDNLMTMNPIESRCAWEECDLLSKINELISSEDTFLGERAAKFMKTWNTN